MHERLDWVDYAKGIGMMLVVLGHVLRGLFSAGMVDSSSWIIDLEWVIYSFHMPLFFILSGLFFERSVGAKGGISFFKNKASVIVYPYIVWMIIQGLIEVAMSSYTNGRPTELIEVFSLWVPRAQYWFLFSLFSILVISFFIYQFAGIYLLLVFSLTLYFTSELIASRYYGFVADFMLYFVLGVFLNIYKEGLFFGIGNALVVAVVSVLGFGFCVFVGGQNLIVELLTALFGSFFVISGAILMQQLKWSLGWLMYLGKISMVIYLVHIIFGSGFRILMHKFLGVDDAYFHMVFGTVFGVLLSVAFYRLTIHFKVKYLFKFG